MGRYQKFQENNGTVDIKIQKYMGQSTSGCYEIWVFFYNKMFKSNIHPMNPIYTIFDPNNNQILPVCIPIYGCWAKTHIITGKIIGQNMGQLISKCWGKYMGH